MLESPDARAWQVGIRFLQGDKEADVREKLSQLDESMRAISGNTKTWNIFNSVPFTDDGCEGLSDLGIRKVVLGSVIYRFDRQSLHLHNLHYLVFGEVDR